VTPAPPLDAALEALAAAGLHAGLDGWRPSPLQAHTLAALLPLGSVVTRARLLRRLADAVGEDAASASPGWARDRVHRARRCLPAGWRVVTVGHLGWMLERQG